MSYNQRIGWKDEVVEHPHRYTEVVNGDGTIEHNPAPGETIQEGTPQSATNFNKMDEALQHICIAFDEMQMTMQAQLRTAEDEIATLKAQVEAIGGDS